MKKEFVPYAEALALKELGFDERPCFGNYLERNVRDGGGIILELWDDEDTEYNPISIILAPTYQQAFRWFREKHGINSTIDNDLYEDDNHIVYSYNLSRLSTADDLIELDEDDFVDTYEEAELECLKKLIEIVKEK